MSRIFAPQFKSFGKGLFLLLLFSLWAVSEGSSATEKKPLTLDLATRDGALVGKSLSAVQWHPSGKLITYLRPESNGEKEPTKLYAYDIILQQEKILLDISANQEKLSLSSYQWSPRGDALLLEGANDFWLYAPDRQQLRRLTSDGTEKQYPTFSPVGGWLAFVKSGDLYALEVATLHLVRLTEDGSETILNGKMDWVYEEELANRSTGRAFEWSPDGRKIIFLRLDESPVPAYPLTNFQPALPAVSWQRYPKPGDPNPIPSVFVVTVGGKKVQRFACPVNADVSLAKKPASAARAGDVEYIPPFFSWTADSKAVAVLALNRPQTRLRVHLWLPEQKQSRLLIEEDDPYWINALEPPRFLKEGNFVWLSERSGWLHLYLYSKDGELLRPLTRGAWQVDEAFEVDETNQWVYFPATQRGPRERHLYRVRLEGGEPEPLTQMPGTHELNLSPAGDYFLDSFSSINHPPEIRLCRSSGVQLATIDKPVHYLEEYNLARTELLELQSADGAALYARLALPANFDPQRKYPVVARVYGGPHEQVVRNYWGATSLLEHYLVQEGFLVWSLDNRGSWGRGHAWETPIFKELGRRELEDQLAGIAYLKSLSYVDGARIGIWGGSYGGTMTLYALTHAPDIFKCGISLYPVTDWKYYDSIYTERYMRPPAENPEGYRKASLLEAASGLRSSLLLVHGTADDNVHMQNSINFIDALIKSRKQFELQLYPGQKHGIRGEAGRLHLNELMVNFLKKNLQGN